MGGWAQLFKLLAGEDIQGDKMNLGMTVLSGFGSGHVNDLAGATLDHNEAVLAERGALHGIRSGGTGIGAIEGVLMLDPVWSVEHAKDTLIAVNFNRGRNSGGQAG